MNYEAKGLLKAKQALEGSIFEQDFLIFEQRLLEVLHEENRYGATPTTRNQKNHITEDLNKIVLAATGRSFNSFCR